MKHRVLLGVSGGISAYKTPSLVRLLRAQGVSVRVVMTDAAMQFVTPIALQAVSNEPVLTNLWTADDPNGMDHIALARWADQIIIAPASADLIARLSAGMANDLLTTLCLASSAPVFLAPAMNKHMWAHPAVQNNLTVLKSRGVALIGPEAGEQACGDVGVGRMSEPEMIVESLLQASKQSISPELSGLQGRKVLITAGPTQEAIDPIRFLSNRSTGVMGYALAACARDAGADVTLVSGPVALDSLPGVALVPVTTAESMHEAVLEHIDHQDIVVCSAAVADYTLFEVSRKKIKKEEGELRLSLQRTKDIIQSIMAMPKPPFCVGFSAETQDVLVQSEEKRKRKKLPVLVANQVGEQCGFGDRKALVSVLTNHGVEEIKASSKKALAPLLWASILRAFPRKEG